MNPRLKALLAQKQALIDESRALEAKADWSAEDEARAEAIPGEIAACDQAIEKAKSLGVTATAAHTSLNGDGTLSSVVAGAIDATKDVAARAASRYRGKVENWSGTAAERATKAYRFGAWVLATMGNKSALAYCNANGLPIQTDTGRAVNAAFGQSEGINEDGGYLVPPEFESDLILLREQYGVFRNLARLQPMSSDTLSRPRRTSGLAAYFVGEAEAAARSKMGWDRVSLTAKKAMVLAYTTTELNEDAIIAMGDTLAGEIAYAFAKLEDNCGFNGDGTSPFGGIVGVRQRLYDVYGPAGGPGLVLGSGNQWSELTLRDFTNVIGSLPQYADTTNAAWMVHKRFYHTVMEQLMITAGGVTAMEVAAGRREPIFMGYPVKVSQMMPAMEANSQVPAVFGDLRLAADFGDRRQTTIRFSEDAAFDTDQIAIRGTERFDINVHDVGSATEAGPVVGLITAAV